MAKKTIPGDASEIHDSLDSALKTGADAVRDGVEKTAAGLEKLAAFNKDTIEAVMKASGAAAKGAEVLGAQWTEFVKGRAERAVEASKAIFGAKSVQAALEAQAEYARGALDAYANQMSKIGDLMVANAKEAVEPLNARMTAFVELMQTRAA